MCKNDFELWNQGVGEWRLEIFEAVLEFGEGGLDFGRGNREIWEVGWIFYGAKKANGSLGLIVGI